MVVLLLVGEKVTGIGEERTLWSDIIRLSIIPILSLRLWTSESHLLSHPSFILFDRLFRPFSSHLKFNRKKSLYSSSRDEKRLTFVSIRFYVFFFLLLLPAIEELFFEKMQLDLQEKIDELKVMIVKRK